MSASSALTVSNGTSSASSDARSMLTVPAEVQDVIQRAPADLDQVSTVHWYAAHIASLPHDIRQEAGSVLNSLAHRMVERGASDLDIGGPATGEQIWLRIDGIKQPDPSFGRLTPQEADFLLLSLLSARQRDQLLATRSIDHTYTIHVGGGARGRRFRASFYFDQQHVALSMRMLEEKPRPLHALGFHPHIEDGFLFRNVRDGLTLITGVTGAGKSTTLDAIIDANNRSVSGHVLIIADPLEYIHESRKCLVRHREVGTDVDSFVDGMVQGLRQDPDIVVVGEMRDAETMATALEMADTGHKVFSTLHTGSALETIDRIIAEYPPDEQHRVRHRLADVLRCVVSQKLVPAVDGGRILAKEVLWMTPAARAAVKNGNTGEIYQMIWQGLDHGMVTMEQDLARLVRENAITMTMARNFANNKQRLVKLIE
ncbi:MAG: AAA family ATPase [Bacteroidetes bacterium]|nr:AAA family ATPase [Bacteroidota bacterium]